MILLFTFQFGQSYGAKRLQSDSLRITKKSTKIRWVTSSLRRPMRILEGKDSFRTFPFRVFFLNFFNWENTSVWRCQWGVYYYLMTITTKIGRGWKKMFLLKTSGSSVVSAASARTSSAVAAAVAFATSMVLTAPAWWASVTIPPEATATGGGSSKRRNSITVSYDRLHFVNYRSTRRRHPGQTASKS